MRIFISFTDPVPCDRVCRLNTNSYTSTTDLLQEIATLCRVKRKWLIAKLKHEIMNVTIMEHSFGYANNGLSQPTPSGTGHGSWSKLCLKGWQLSHPCNPTAMISNKFKKKWSLNWAISSPAIIIIVAFKRVHQAGIITLKNLLNNSWRQSEMGHYKRLR